MADQSAPILEQPPEVVCVQGLWSVFGKGTEAFAVHQDLDLSVRRGEILALVGGSGTGKTVLLRQMLGLLHPARGSVTVLGRPAAQMGGEGAASRVGMLFQHGALYSAFNVLENVAFALNELGTLPPDVVRDAAIVKLQMVGLKPEHATRMPADLSGGMIKRVALARALIMGPPLLLLDEPTAGLDPNGADEFCALVRELGTLPLDLVRDAAMVKLQMVGLDPAHAHKMPADLSGGMVKRVALARALIMDPPLLLLDEPTAGLDPDRSDAFCDLVRALHRELGLTIVMVTHDLDTIYEISTRVAVVADKHVIVHASPREVIGHDHPFVRQFFLGGRGLRAMELLHQQEAHG